MQNVLFETERSIKSLIHKETAETLLAAKHLLSGYKMACDELKADELLTLFDVSLSEAVCEQKGTVQKRLCLLDARFKYLAERSERLLYGYIDEVGELNTASDEFYLLSQFITEALTTLKAIKPVFGYVDFEFERGVKAIKESLIELEQVLVKAIHTLINRFEVLLIHQNRLRHRYSVLNRQTSDRSTCGVKLFLSSLSNRFQSMFF